LGGLYKLDLPETAETIFRGVKDKVYTTKDKGDDIIWWAFSSSTASMGVLYNPQYLGPEGDRTMFTIKSRCFVDIRKYSNYQDLEDERLLLPGTFFQIKDVLDAGHGLRMIQLDEQPTPPLLDFLHPQLRAPKAPVVAPTIAPVIAPKAPVVAPKAPVVVPKAPAPPVMKPLNIPTTSSTFSNKVYYSFYYYYLFICFFYYYLLLFFLLLLLFLLLLFLFSFSFSPPSYRSLLFYSILFLYLLL
jgi:hypothetical protein